MRITCLISTLVVRTLISLQICCIVLILWSGQAYARRGITGILEGRVRDKQTKELLPSVNVMIVGSTLGTATDEKGYFRISNIRAGDYDVRFSVIGYNSVVVKKVTILPDLRTRVEVDLEPSSVLLPTMEIVATRPLIQVDQAATAFQIEQGKLDKLPLTQFQDIVGLQPGTTMEGNIRGGKITDALYLVDGLPIQDVIKGGIGTSIPKSSISNITITTGGHEAEYGNALSGIINVVTKSGENNHTLNTRVERDNWLPEAVDKQVDMSAEGEITASGPVIANKLYYFSANVAAFGSTRWWQDFEHFFPLPVKKEFSGLSKLEYLLSPTLRLGLQGIYSIQDWRDYEYSWRFNLSGLPKETRTSYRLALTASKTISNNAFFTVSLSTFFNQSRINEGSKQDMALLPYEYDFYLRYILSGARNWWENTQQRSYSLKADLTWQVLGNHLLKAGVAFDQYDIASDLVKYEPQLTYFGKPIPGAPMLNYSNSYNYSPRSGSVYLQDKIQIVEEGSNISFGVRWDFFDPLAERPVVEFIPISQTDYTQNVTGKVRTSLKQQLSPRVSVALPVNPTTFFFLNFGQYFQFPMFEYLYSGLNPVQLKRGTKNVQAGNADLQPESLVMWEMGYKQTIREDLVASATYFRKNMKNQVDVKTLVPFDSKAAGDYGFASYVNNAEGDAYGLELVVSRERNERLSGSISYTYMVTEATSEYADQNLNIAQWGFKLAPESYPLSWDQRHTIKADIDFKTPGDIQSNIIVLYNSPRPYTYYPTRDGFTPLDTSKAFIPNNARMGDFFNIDWKVSRSFPLKGMNAVLTLYADIRNLLNKKNVKWMDSQGRIGGELGDPGAYSTPRRVRVGIRVDL
jgi:outer membrane receptor for ferrienterochelin and colicin